MGSRNHACAAGRCVCAYGDREGDGRAVVGRVGTLQPASASAGAQVLLRAVGLLRLLALHCAERWGLLMARGRWSRDAVQLRRRAARAQAAKGRALAALTSPAGRVVSSSVTFLGRSRALRIGTRGRGERWTERWRACGEGRVCWRGGYMQRAACVSIASAMQEVGQLSAGRCLGELARMCGNC